MEEVWLDCCWPSRWPSEVLLGGADTVEEATRKGWGEVEKKVVFFTRALQGIDPNHIRLCVAWVAGVVTRV